MKILKYVLLIVVAISMSFLFAQSVGEIYADIFNDHGFGVNAAGLAGIPTIYIFLIALLFSAFGETKKYWWMILILLPVAFIVFYLDWYHWYFWIPLGLIGWGIGIGIQKLISKLNK